MIKKSGNIENAIATIGGKNAPTFDEINEIRKIFLEPKITDDYFLKWIIPNNEKIIEILCEKYHFKIERVEPIINKLSNIEKMIKQRTLF